ncbi:Prp21p Ecym_1117 [Eremothecium cymbalariae DBVPG|uniref:SURP motif domain-containing protein n=1 Tax=Eremothecium cymbalariae (strain CBS 270.75 / DBVPG 7215 / KCTC 17166 / NRRL Y-17582) TaxID=931890 RepID=G8JML6_ERECY|nr:hypothetical protein Ecym_1117 [Eremothecium cymbalariae DBVPG\
MITFEDIKAVPLPPNILVPEDENIKNSILQTVLKLANNQNVLSQEQPTKKNDIPYANPNDKYHDYYMYYMKRFPKASDNDNKEYAAKKKKNPQTPAEPYPFVFSTYNERIPPRDLEIIKTTAVFCIINEDIDYISKLQTLYKDDPTFQFLDPSHSLYQVFTSFINQYKQLTAGEYGLLCALGDDHIHTIMKRAFERSRYKEFTETMKEQQQYAFEKMKIKFAAFEWHDYNLVGSFTIDEQDLEKELQPALDFDKMYSSSLTKEFKDIFTDMTPKTTSKGASEPVNKELKPRKKRQIKIKPAGEMRINRNTESTHNTTKKIECPITHKLIHEDKLERHLQILLTDPNYKEEREQYKAKYNLTNITSQGVYENIKRVLDKNSQNDEQARKKQKSK